MGAMPSLPASGPGSPGAEAFAFARHGPTTSSFVSARPIAWKRGKIPLVPARTVGHTCLTDGRLGLLLPQIFAVEEGVPGFHHGAGDNAPLAFQQYATFSLHDVEEHLLTQEGAMLLILKHSVLNALQASHVQQSLLKPSQKLVTRVTGILSMVVGLCTNLEPLKSGDFC
jgi:hypothetical protein